VHNPSGDPPLALRIECGGKVVAYSGDTEWTEGLIPACRGADLLVAEAFSFEKEIKYHLSFATLKAHLGELAVKRLILTHMGPEMLTRLDTLACEYAEDGKVFTL
jgi:ribonuclease BN (tRNA processing enzyme)